MGSAVTVTAAGGADRPRPSQKLGVMVHDWAGTQPCARPPHDVQWTVQLPLPSALTATPDGAAGPSAPVVIRRGAESVPTPLI